MKKQIFSALLLLLITEACHAQLSGNVVRNGVPWFDQNGNIVNAHGACIVEDAGKYWLFGEWKSDESNAFPGFSCYSSTDLVNWTFERVVLPMQKEGIMGPNRVGERVKVMKCPKTGEYVMFMHSDNMEYKDPYTAVATCKTINGEYKMRGPLMYQGKPIKRWDMGTFQDSDGKGYVLIHHGPIYRLTDDYLSVEAQVADVKGMGESPAMFNKDGMYYLLSSNLTSWEKNDNFYHTAPSIEGPWVYRGLFCPSGKLTYNSQCTFVFPIKRGDETTYMYMGDRWSYPRQASAATYVWLPMLVDGTKVSIPEYWQGWNVDNMQPVDLLHMSSTIPAKEWQASEGWQNIGGRWMSNSKGAVLRVPFVGTQAIVVGEANQHGGYAKVSVQNELGDTIYSSLVDFYSKYRDESVRIITPEYENGTYTLSIENTGYYPVWTDKAETLFGSDDCFINVDAVRKMK